LNRVTPHFLASWKDVDVLLTDVSNDRLEKADIHLGSLKIAPVSGKKSATQTAAFPDDSEGELPVHAL
jgi:hypothetical protein